MANACHLKTNVGYQAVGVALVATTIFLAERVAIERSAADHEKKEKFRVFKALPSMKSPRLLCAVCATLRA